MVAAVHYFATADDHEALLDYLGEPEKVALRPWPLIGPGREALSRTDALAAEHVMLVSAELGEPAGVRPGESGAKPSPKTTVFNLLNWERLQPGDEDLLVDVDSSPVLLWQPAKQQEETLFLGEVGSQADSMAAVSAEYERWAKRVLDWMRRKGTRVWGTKRDKVRPDLDIKLEILNSVYALPEALAALEKGAKGRP